MRTGVLALVALAALGGRAWAYPTGSQFDVDPVNGTVIPNSAPPMRNYDGAGGLVFTGSPRMVGHACDVCHTDPPHQIGVKIEADDTSLFDTGWKAAKTYHLRVVLTGEHAGLMSRNNRNGFGLEIDDPTGTPANGYQAFVDGKCVSPSDPNLQNTPDVYVTNDGRAVTHSGMGDPGQAQWDFCWTAPNAGVGPLILYVAVVDGNGGDGTANYSNDTKGDDVFAGSVPLLEHGGSAVGPQQGACQVAGRGAAGAGAIVLLLAGLFHRRLRGLLLLLLLVAAGAGCTTVKPWQKERLAKRIMKFAPDPDEDELDLHMLEAREGSSGGYGSAGGGCGCN